MSSVRESLGVGSKVRKKIMKQNEGLIRSDQFIFEHLLILDHDSLFHGLAGLEWIFLNHLLE